MNADEAYSQMVMRLLDVVARDGNDPYVGDYAVSEYIGSATTALEWQR